MSKDLHEQIMNIPGKRNDFWTKADRTLYSEGHRDARHAAAELALAAPSVANGAAELDAVAEAIFKVIKPSNMIDKDWKSGAILGFENGFRDQVKEAARAAIAALDKPVVAMAEPFHHYGMSAEQVQQLLSGGLKPEEISGADDVQHDRVRELVWWFARLTQGEANPKWTTSHACELAYFVATQGMNRHIDLKAVRDAAFKEGVNITPEERGTLERIGFATPQTIAAGPDAKLVEALQQINKLTDSPLMARIAKAALAAHAGQGAKA